MSVLIGSVAWLQTFQSSEKLGLYGKNTVGNTDYYIASGDSGHITVGGTIGGMVIAGEHCMDCSFSTPVLSASHNSFLNLPNKCWAAKKYHVPNLLCPVHLVSMQRCSHRSCSMLSCGTRPVTTSCAHVTACVLTCFSILCI